jgi:hypothetical protein
MNTCSTSSGEPPSERYFPMMTEGEIALDFMTLLLTAQEQR